MSPEENNIKVSVFETSGTRQLTIQEVNEKKEQLGQIIKTV